MFIDFREREKHQLVAPCSHTNQGSNARPFAAQDAALTHRATQARAPNASFEVSFRSPWVDSVRGVRSFHLQLNLMWDKPEITLRRLEHTQRRDNKGHGYTHPKSPEVESSVLVGGTSVCQHAPARASQKTHPG